MNPTPTSGTSPDLVQVRVVQQAVTLDGVTHLKNQTFFVTPDQAKALGDFVQVVPPPEPKPAPSAPPKPAAAASLNAPSTSAAK